MGLSAEQLHKKGSQPIQLVSLVTFLLSFIKPAYSVGPYGMLHVFPTLGPSGGGTEHVSAGTERLLGNLDCWDRVTRAPPSAAPLCPSLPFPPSSASPATVSSPPCGFSVTGTAGLLTPPPLAPRPDWLAAAFWGFASSSTLSNGLGAETLGL